MSSYYYVKWETYSAASFLIRCKLSWSAELSAPLSPSLAAGQDAACQVDPRRVIQPGPIVLASASSKDAAAKPSDSSTGLGGKVFFAFPHCSVSSAFSKWNNKNIPKCQSVGFCKQILEPGRLKCDEVSMILLGQVKFCLLDPGCCK